jgi:hypothetical protein
VAEQIVSGISFFAASNCAEALAWWATYQSRQFTNGNSRQFQKLLTCQGRHILVYMLALGEIELVNGRGELINFN